MSFTETGFPPSSLSSSFPLSHRHSSSGPLGMQTRCSWWFLLWAELRYSVIYDLAFSSFRRTKPDSHAQKWWEPQNAEKIAIFFRSFSQTTKTPDIFSSPATLLCYSLHWFFPFSVPHTLPLFSIIYTLNMRSAWFIVRAHSRLPISVIIKTCHSMPLLLHD